MKEKDRKIERVEMVYDRGTAKNQEDGRIDNSPFFGVVDAFSAPYTAETEQMSFGGLSGGEMVKGKILREFHIARSDDSLEELIESVNNKVAKTIHSYKIPIEQSDQLPAACFAIMKMTSDYRGNCIDIIQAGDCLAIFVAESGQIFSLKNQARLHEFREQRIIDRLLKTYNGNQEKMWNDFYPLLKKSRLRDINKNTDAGYAVLNGQKDFSKYYKREKVDSGNLDFVIIGTDGLISPELFWSEEFDLAEKIVSVYEEEGLKGILEKTRKSESKGKRGYTKHCEATGMAIKFQ